MSYAALALTPFASPITGLLARDPHGRVAERILCIAQIVTGASTAQAALSEIQADANRAQQFQCAISAAQIELEQLAEPVSLALEQSAHGALLVPHSVRWPKAEHAAQRLATHLVCRRTGLYAASLLLALGLHAALLIWQAQVSIAWIALGLLGSLEGGLIVALVGRGRKKPSQAPDAIALGYGDPHASSARHDTQSLTIVRLLERYF
jgi:hypothetical protein